MARRYVIQSSSSPASGLDYRSLLNSEQSGAVTSPNGHSLVIAGAGAGKTRTLTYRVAWLLDQGIEPGEILLLTFTNKAAREMTVRVRDLVSRDTSALWAGTFHSIGSRILRRHAEEIGFNRSFTILDRDDQKSMLGHLVKSMKLPTSERRFPKADVILGVFSMARNTRNTVRKVLFTKHPGLYEWHEAIESLDEAYEAKKLAANSMDFDDLLLRTVELLEGHPDLLRWYQEKFRHVLVDEYQDTNQVQGELVDLLTGGGASLMAVGDDAQSIYSWRGADLSLILGFADRYPGARLFHIETNYRSVPEILELSNAAIRANRIQFDKNLRADRGEFGEKPALVPLRTPSDQAAFVAQRIGELVDSGVPRHEIAVLYRAHYQCMEVQLELTSRQVPFAITSGLRFFEQAHIKDVTAFLRFVANRRDEVSFNRMVMLMPGCGAGTAAKLWQRWLASGWADRDHLPPTWSEILAGFPVPKKSVSFWQQLGLTLDELSPGGVMVRPEEMLASVIRGVYEDYAESAYENSDSRAEDLAKLVEFAARFEELDEFLNQLSLLGEAEEESRTQTPTNQDESKVTLSTIHQAKGLEWRVVFVIGLVQGQFPSTRILESGSGSALEEERRLFYVAITRAKDQLHLTYPMFNPRDYSGNPYCEPSLFLAELPQRLVECWEVSQGWG